MGRVLHHIAGGVFLLRVVFVVAKWAFVGGLAVFGFFAWNTRPSVEERERRAEQARQERPVTRRSTRARR